MSPYSEKASKMSSSCASSWTPDTSVKTNSVATVTKVCCNALKGAPHKPEASSAYGDLQDPPRHNNNPALDGTRGPRLVIVVVEPLELSGLARIPIVLLRRVPTHSLPVNEP